MENITRTMKDYRGQKMSSEIGVVTSLKPFAFKINGIEYSARDWAIYLPAVDRIKQFEEIEVETDDPNPENTPQKNKGKAFVDIGDLELEPDSFERRFLIGDLIDVTDRGDSFIVHGRLVRVSTDDETEELYSPTHRD